MQKKVYDVDIIGGGPAGMFAAFYAGLHDLDTQLIESLPQLGGQLGALYPEKKIWDVAGAPGITGKELIGHLKEQLKLVDVDYLLNASVTNVKKDTDGLFVVTTARGVSYARSIIIALGNGAFSPRKLALPGAAEMEGQQVQYFVTHKADYAGKTVAVLGGGNSAVDMALMLAPVAKQVYLVHRRPQFRALPKMVDQLKSSEVEIVTPYLPKAIHKVGQQASLSLKRMRADGERQLTVDRVLVDYGFTADHSALDKWDVHFDSERQMIKVDSEMTTSVPGIYAIGDGVTYPGKQPLIATAFGEGPIAINALAKKLYPHKQMAMHSSSMHLEQQWNCR